MSKLPPKRPGVPASPSKVVYREPRSSSINQQRNSINGSFKIGDRVTTGGKTGTVAFIGPTKFAEGEWVGISLDEAVGKNDGSHGDTRYFETDPNHGLFCRLDKIQHLSINGSAQRKSLDNQLRQSVIERASRIPSATREEFSARGRLQIGDRVMINGTKFGTLQYVGRIHVEQGIWCGISLEGPLGKHDGKIESKRYFHCPKNHGIFAPLRHVEKVQTDPRLSILSTDSSNLTFDPSTEDLHLSRFSSSSDSLDEMPTRPPIPPMRQTSLSNDLAPTDTKSSSQVAQLQDNIREKDALINKLEAQLKKNQLEDLLTTRMIEDVNEKMKQLQAKYDATENENFNLLREQCELKQRLEDMEVELTVPDDHAVLSPEEYQLYEKSKGLIRELEERVKHHEQDERRIQDYQIKLEQATKEIEAIRLELRRMEEENQILENNSNSVDYEEQIKDYQAEIDLLKQQIQDRLQTQSDDDTQAKDKLLAELEKSNEEKKQQGEELLETITQLKQDYQELQKELDELNHREIKAHKTLQQSESQFEQQIDDYHRRLEEAISQIEGLRTELGKVERENANLRQTMSELTERLETQNENESDALQEAQSQLVQSLLEIEQLRTKLTALEEEKINSDNQLNQAIDVLKTNFEELQAKQETQANETLHERDCELQQLQLELDNLKQERIQWNETIDSLTQELEALKAELQDRGRVQKELEVYYQSKLEEQKYTLENQFHEHIQTLKRDHEKLLSEQKQQEKTLQAQYDQEFDEYQRNVELAIHQRTEAQSELLQLQEEKANSEKSLNDQIENLQKELKAQEKQFQREKSEYKLQITSQEERLKEYESTLDQTQELFQQREKLAQDNTKLKRELEDLRNEHDPKEIESLNQQIADLQKMHSDYLQRQTEKEKESINKQQAQENFWKEKINEYEMKTALMKSEFMVEMENIKLDYDQEVLRLKSLVSKTPPAKGKH